MVSPTRLLERDRRTLLEYSARGDGYDEMRGVEHGQGAFTVWYADSAGELVGVLTHERDEDYERGGDLLARRASLREALEHRADCELIVTEPCRPVS